MFSFCRPVSSKKRFLPYRELDKEFSFTLFATAADVKQNDWNLLTGNSCYFLNLNYLSLLEKCGYSVLNARYIIVYKNKIPCGIIYFQVSDFKAGAISGLLINREEKQKSHRKALFEKYITKNQDETLMRLVTCGNNLVNGEFGFLFNSKVNKQKEHEIVVSVTEVIAQEEKLKGVISAVQIKDFYGHPGKTFEEEKYACCSVEPNMVVEIPETVKSLNDYIALFSKKYRNRAKAIFRDLEGISVRELGVSETAEQENKLYALYENVFEQAKFKINKLPLGYFSNVKKLFGNSFKIKAFYKEGKPVAFATWFVMPDNSLEAHYIGLDYGLNDAHNLYQNILYLLLDEAIKGKMYKVNLGRTAAEIKTTVGARPEDLMCCIKPLNTFSRIIQKPFMALLQPTIWTPLNPFKENLNETVLS